MSKDEEINGLEDIKLIKDLVRTWSTEPLLEEIERQLDVLAGEKMLIDAEVSEKYIREAQKLNRLRTVQSYCKGHFAEYTGYLELTEVSTNKLYNIGVIAGLRKMLFYLSGEG